MNVEKMIQLAKFLETEVKDIPSQEYKFRTLPLEGNFFQMARWITTSANNCGTAACIAGWCAIAFESVSAQEDWIRNNVVAVGDVAQAALELTHKERGDLFTRTNWPRSFQVLANNAGERLAAVALLRHLACTELQERKALALRMEE